MVRSISWRYRDLALAALLLGSGEVLAQNSWGGIWLGGVHSSYERSSTTEVYRPSLELAYGFRYGHDLGRTFRFILDLGFMTRSVDQELYLQFTTPRTLLATTRTDIKSVSISISGAVCVVEKRSWEARLLLGAIISGPSSVTMDVISPYGTGAHFTNTGDKQTGLALKIGGRYAHRLHQQVWAFVELSGCAILKDEYEVTPNHGSSIQPFLPERTAALICALGLEFGPKPADPVSTP